MKNESKKWKRNCPNYGKEMLYQTKSQLEYSIHGRPDKRDKPSGLCKECYSSSWKRFGGFKHNTEIKTKMSKRFTGDSNPMFGKQHSDETRMKIKEKRKLQTITEETKLKISNANKGKRVSIETREKISRAFKNRKFSEETKKKQRIAAIKRIERTKFGDTPMMPNYNPKEMDYFKKLESDMGLDGIYIGKNEYQYKIESLGYFPDFYDSEKNVVIEYDERHHYTNVYENSLKESDIIRQTEIINTLNCKFYRYNETTGILYEVVL